MTAAAMVATEIPSVLLRYQQEAIQLSYKHQFLMIEKSRRTGVTYAFAAKAVLDAAPATGAVNTFYIAYNKDMTREFVAYCGTFAAAFDKVSAAPSEFLFDDGSEKGILALRVDFPSGKAIVALSSKPRSLRGMQGNVIIDEAAYHDDLEGVHTAAMALTMWGGHVVAISTHAGADNPFATMIDDIRKGKLEGWVQRVTLDDALVDGLYKRICLVGGDPWSPEAEAKWKASLYKRYGDGAAQELDVIAARGSGAYFPRALVEACQSVDFAVIRLTPPDGFDTQERWCQERWVEEWLGEHVRPLVVAGFLADRRSFFGQDFARSSDLSVVACGQLDERSRLLNPLVVEMRNVPFRAQKQVLDFLVRTMPQWSTGKMDARGNGQQLAEDMRQDWGGERIEAVMATQQTYLERMPRTKTRFEDRTIVIPQSEDLVDDLRQVKLVRGIPQVVDRVADKSDGASGKRHGDYAIALMNLVNAADEDVQPIELQTADQPRAHGGDFRATGTGFGTITRRDDFAAARGAW